MPCCALRKRKKHLMFFPFLLFFLVFIFGGFLVGLFALGGMVSAPLAAKRDRTFTATKRLLNGLTERILHEPFLFDSTVRCRVSGRLMHFSGGLAGAVYKYFNVILLGTIILSLCLLIQGLLVLGI